MRLEQFCQQQRPSPEYHTNSLNSSPFAFLGLLLHDVSVANVDARVGPVVEAEVFHMRVTCGVYVLFCVDTPHMLNRRKQSRLARVWNFDISIDLVTNASFGMHLSLPEGKVFASGRPAVMEPKCPLYPNEPSWPLPLPGHILQEGGDSID